MVLRPPVEERELAKAELTAYINDLLSEYTAKTLGLDKPPAWRWTLHWPTFYRPADKVIYVPEHIYALAYVRNPTKTKRALRWAVAHEFWHYVQDVRGEWVIRVPTLTFPRVAEYMATKQATRLSGITDPEGMVLTVEVVDLAFWR